jgi:hypothetical protein
MLHMTDPTYHKELRAELQARRDAELAAGNCVAETSKGRPLPESIVMLLAAPFHNAPALLPPNVQPVCVNNPQWWKQEYMHAPTGHRLACRS